MRYWFPILLLVGCSGADPATAPANTQVTAEQFLERAREHGKLGDYEAALDDLAEALQLEPGNADALYLRGLSLSELGRTDEALGSFNRCLALDNQHAGASGARGVLHNALGRHRDALSDLELAATLDPEAAIFANDLAWLLATCPDDSIRDGKRAVHFADIAYASDNRWQFADTFAAALAETGEFERAIALLKQAIQQCPPEAQAKLRNRLTSYVEGKSWRE